MAKKQISKNSRAARRSTLDPTVEIQDTVEDEDSRARVLRQLAEKELRSGNKTSIPEGMDELTAIAKGIHPEMKKQPAGKVTKAGKKKSKNDKKKMEKAEMIQDMLSEKIDQAKKRHKTVKSYRASDPE